MPAVITNITGEPHVPPSAGGGKRIRTVALGLWSLTVALAVAGSMADPSLLNVVAATGFILLFICVNAQLLLVRWMANRHWRRMMARLHGSSYMSELYGLPNRNYLLSELRREMPLSRATGVPFVLVGLSFDTLDEVRRRRGEDVGERAVAALAELLRRVTRHGDFAAHIGEGHFCVMLNDCRLDQAWTYMQAIPGAMAVSDGRRMFDVPLSARMVAYDLEALYASDLLDDVDRARPLRRKEEFFGSEAA